MNAQQRSAQRQQVVARAAATLTAGATLTPALLASLASVGITATAASAALTLIGASSAPTVLPVGTASRSAAVSEQVYRAAYYVAAAERLQSRIDQGMSVRQAIVAERSAFNAHRAARANRLSSARAVDVAARTHGALLGWSARMDARTSAECRAADRRNFSVFSRPVIGWPGAVHPNCRCRPVAPFAGAGLVDQMATQAERREAVA